MAGERLDCLSRTLERQRVQLEAFREELAASRDEATALRTCLTKSGTLRMDAFQSALKDLRLKRLLNQVLSMFDKTVDIGLFAGPTAIRAACCASKLFRDTMEGVWSISRKSCPGYCIYVCGGATRYDSVLCSVERLSIGAGTWETMPDMAEQRRRASACTVAGKIYVCGGVSFEISVSSAECFDPYRRSWETIPHMGHARDSAMILANGGTMYVFGGRRKPGWPNPEEVLNVVENFQPSLVQSTYLFGLSEAWQQTWREMQPMRQARFDAAIVESGGSLMVIGGCAGCSESGEKLSSVECLELATGTWQNAPPMVQPRSGATACKISGVIYVCGGHAEDMVPMQSLECFDSEVGAWHQRPLHSDVVRTWSAAVATADRLLIFGGYLEEIASCSAEEFDPLSDSMLALPNMNQARFNPAVAVTLG